MKTSRSLFLGVALFAAGTSACVGNNASLTIVGLSQFSPDCVTSVGGTQITGITVDLNVARSAHIAPVVRNGLLPTASTNPPEVELHTILLEGANVKFRTGTISRLGDRFSASFATVEPSQGRATLPFELLTPRDIDILRGDRALSANGSSGTITAVIKVEGRMTDAGHITSSEIAVPIHLCRGCLFIPLKATETCDPPPLPPGFSTPPTVDVCRPGQDEPIDACQYAAFHR